MHQRGILDTIFVWVHSISSALFKTVYFYIVPMVFCTLIIFQGMENSGKSVYETNPIVKLIYD
jgi:hypothetical protein